MFPKYRSKVHAVSGDCSLPGLGLSEDERHLLTHEVDIVFHGAATVKFDEPLRLAVTINVNGTRDVLSLAKQMKKLKAIVHLSTAYTNCNREEIDEKFYDPPITHQAMAHLVDSIPDKLLDRLTPALLGKWPNTYSMTKAVAEHLVSQEGPGLPIAVFRPSIVVGIKDGPIPGWVGNRYGPAGMMVACATGILRSVHCDPNALADNVPVDMAINAMIAIAWEVGSNSNHATAQDIPIYNYVSSVETPLLYREFERLVKLNWSPIPPQMSYWHHSLALNKHYWMHWLHSTMFHFLPALLIDAAAGLVGKKPGLWNMSTKIENLCQALSFFTTHSWKFSNGNVQALWLKLSEEDKDNVMFDMKQLKWADFMRDYTRGCRVYLLKDDMSTVPQALVRQRRLYWMHQATKTGLIFVLLRLIRFILSIMFTLKQKLKYL